MKAGYNIKYMIKLCVFDMDGLLLDSERMMYYKTGLEVSASLGKPISGHFLTEMMGASWASIRENIIKEYGEDFPVDEYFDRYFKRVNYIIDNETIPLRPGVKQILDYCKENKIMMAVATSSNAHTAKMCLSHSKIYDYFDYIVTVEDVKNTKPDPEIFLKAIERSGYSKKEALIFEDGHNGARAAINGGCRLVLVEDLAYLDEKDKKEAELHTDRIDKCIEYIRKENETATGI